MFIMFSLVFMARIVIKGENELKYLVSNLVYLIILFALIIAVVSLLFFFDILINKDFIYNNSITELPQDSLSEADYNIALLPMFFGIFSILFLLPEVKKKFTKAFLSSLLLVFSLQIFLSGSRRGIILFIIILLLLSLSLVIAPVIKKSFLKNYARESIPFLVCLFLLSFSLYIFIDKASYYHKNKFLELVGSKNILITKYKITKKILRYASVIDKSLDYNRVNTILWSHVFVPEDPDSGWGSRIHKTIYPLTGKNVEIVPPAAKGYLMDSTCNASYYSDSNACESYTQIVRLNTTKGERYKASVFCFVSDSFNAKPVVFSVSAYCINSKIVTGNAASYYNLDYKGSWQKLELDFMCNEGEVPVYLSFIKNDVQDFRELHGYVIYAYPNYTKVIGADSLITNEPYSRTNALVFASQRHFYNSSGMFSFPLSVLYQPDKKLIDPDPIRSFVVKLISEDTTYYPYKSHIILNETSSTFLNDRILRWEFGLKIFSLEYSWKQKIFGGGFNFLNWYGYYFMKDKTISDWPHNPFLSILLYSGIFGLLIYFFLLYKVFLYYFKYLHEYPLLFIFFIATFFFSFFSAGSPFDPPIMGFFVILPFFIHSILKKGDPARAVS
jgi:hypothetical protein